MNCETITTPQTNTFSEIIDKASISSQEWKKIKSGFFVIGSEKKIKEICDICNKILEERWKKALPVREKVLKKYKELKRFYDENETVEFANRLWDDELDSSEVALIEMSEIAFLVPMPLKNYLKNTDEANILKDLDQAILEKLKPLVNQFMVFENSKVKVEKLLIDSIRCLSKENMDLSDQWVLLGLKPLTHLLWLSYNKKLNYSYELCRFGGGAKNASEDKISVALRELDEEAGISLPYGEEFVELASKVYLFDANKYEHSNKYNVKGSLQLVRCGQSPILPTEEFTKLNIKLGVDIKSSSTDGSTQDHEENQQFLPQANFPSLLPSKKTPPSKANIFSIFMDDSENEDDLKSEDESANCE